MIFVVEAIRSRRCSSLPQSTEPSFASIRIAPLAVTAIPYAESVPSWWTRGWRWAAAGDANAAAATIASRGSRRTRPG